MKPSNLLKGLLAGVAGVALAGFAVAQGSGSTTTTTTSTDPSATGGAAGSTTSRPMRADRN